MTACVFKFIDFAHCGDDILAFFPHLVASGSPRADRGPLTATWSIGADGRPRRAWRVAAPR
jgi:hypothetical protein